MIEKPISYGRQWINDEDIEAVVETLKSDYLTQGPKIKEFEDKFAEYVGAKYAVAVNNATAGLHIAAKAMGVKPGQKVIVTTITFLSSANCVRFCGGDVVFCDIDPNNYLLSIQSLRGLLEATPKGTYSGIIPVDFAGYPQNLEELKTIADEYGLWIIEDACHAPGAYFTDSKGLIQRSGNCVYSDCAVFSFHPVKHIATGEGGMVTTNSKDIYEHLCSLRSHGTTKDPEKLQNPDGAWRYEMTELGYNYRITDFQAALGISQLKRASWSIERRQEIAAKYNAAFKANPKIITPFVAQGVKHAYHLYIIQVPSEKRKGLYEYLKENKIYSQILYIPVHTQPYYRQCLIQNLPVAEDYYQHCLALPMFPTLTDEEQDWVIEKVLEYIK